MAKDTTAQQEPSTDALSFMQRLDEVRQKFVSADARMLIGSQTETGTFPTNKPFNGRVGKTATHLSNCVFHPDEKSDRWLETRANVHSMLCLLLDDQGNPEKAANVPTLEPTFKITTSKGSAQWGYVYAEFTSANKGLAMAKGAVEAGLSDPFINKKANHWFRLPGAVPPPKAAKGKTDPAVLTEWTGKTYLYADLAEGLGITPVEGPSAVHHGPEEFDLDSAVQDPIWQWLEKTGKTSGDGWPFDGRGFADVLCPNHEAHDLTAGGPYGRYCPPNKKSKFHGSFSCFHGHCNGIKGDKLTIRDLRKWVEAEGGPTVAEGMEYNPRRPTADDMKKLAELIDAVMTEAVIECDPITVSDSLGETFDLTGDEAAIWHCGVEKMNEYELDALLDKIIERRQTPAQPVVGQLPGRMHELVLWAQRAAHRQLPYDVCAIAVLTGMSGAIAHRAYVRWWGGPTALNIETLVRMGTGVGKEGLRTTVSTISLLARGAKAIDEPASKEGLHRVMVEQNNSAVVIMPDEFGKKLSSVSAGKNPNLKGVMDWCLQAYGLPFGTMTSRPTRDPKLTMPAVVNPYLVTFATAAADLANGLTSDDITGGFLNRKIFVNGPDYVPLKERRTPRQSEMPPALAKYLKVDLPYLLDPRHMGPDDKMPVPNPLVCALTGRVAFTMDPAAEDIYFEWVDVIERNLSRTDDRNSYLWARVAQHTVAVAGIIAVGSYTSGKPTVDVVAMTAAINVLKRSVSDFQALAKYDISEGTEASKDKQAIMRVLRHARKPMSKNTLTRKTQMMAARTRNAALDDLIAGGQVVEEVDPAQTKPKTMLRLPARHG